MNTVGAAVASAFAGLEDQIWLVIPGGLVVFGIIYGIGIVKKAGKRAIS